MDSEFIDGETEFCGVTIPVVAGDLSNPSEAMRNLAEVLKDTALLDCNRPYTDQQPKRAQHLVSGLTRRDISDCMVRGFLLSGSHVNPEGYRKAKENTCYNDDLYGWDLNQLDPGAVIRNACNEIEKMMGIFPNLLD